MGLWNGSNLNTNATSVLVNQVYNNEAIDIVSEAAGLVYALTDGKDKINGQFDMAKNRVTDLGGNKLQVRFFGKLTTIDTVDDGNPEVTNATPSYTSDSFGAGEFPLTHYFKLFGVPDSEIERFVGQEALTANWLAERTMEYTASFRGTLATGANAAVVGCTRTVLGNWQHPVSDGTTNVAGFNETLLASYGTLNRADAGNVDLRGRVFDINGTWDFPNLDKAKLRANRKNAMAKGTDLVLCGEAQYLRAVGLLNNKPQVLISQDEKWRKWGGEHFRYSGMNFVCDYNVPDDRMGILDTSTWVLWDKNPKQLVANGFKENPFAPSMLLKLNKWIQLLCVSPANNAKLIRLA